MMIWLATNRGTLKNAELIRELSLKKKMMKRRKKRESLEDRNLCASPAKRNMTSI